MASTVKLSAPPQVLQTCVEDEKGSERSATKVMLLNVVLDVEIKRGHLPFAVLEMRQERKHHLQRHSTVKVRRGKKVIQFEPQISNKTEVKLCLGVQMSPSALPC